MWWHVNTGYLAVSNTAVRNLEQGYHFVNNPKQYTAFASGLRRVTQESTDSLSKLSVVPGSVNSELLERATAVVDETVRSARARVEEVLRDLDEGSMALQDVAERLAGAHAEHAATLAARSIWLGVNQQNRRAQRFYAKHSFTINGTKTFHLGSEVENDFVMVRPL